MPRNTQVRSTFGALEVTDEFKEAGNPFTGHFENTIASRWKNFQSPIVYDLDVNDIFKEELDKNIAFPEHKRALTEYPYEEITIEDAQEFINDERIDTGLIQQYFQTTKNKILRNDYFKKLFPVFSAQKPGNDFYAVMALIQFIVTIYIILFWTFMERDYTDVTSQKLQIKQFSALLVLAAFFQIFFMLADRFIYISKSFRIKKAEDSDESDDEIDTDIGIDE
jgi:hypothetical protein